MPPSIQSFYRRNMPNPEGVPFRQEFQIDSALDQTITPSAGTVIVVDKIVFAIPAAGIGSRTLEFQSSLGASAEDVGVFEDTAGTEFTVSGDDGLLAMCDEVYNASSLTTPLVIGIAHMNPPMKLTSSEGLKIVGGGSGGALSGSAVAVHGWVIADETDY